jgi:hypothetical protein
MFAKSKMTLQASRPRFETPSVIFPTVSNFGRKKMIIVKKVTILSHLTCEILSTLPGEETSSQLLLSWWDHCLYLSCRAPYRSGPPRPPSWPPSRPSSWPTAARPPSSLAIRPARPSSGPPPRPGPVICKYKWISLLNISATNVPTSQDV